MTSALIPVMGLVITLGVVLTIATAGWAVVEIRWRRTRCAERSVMEGREAASRSNKDTHLTDNPAHDGRFTGTLQ